MPYMPSVSSVTRLSTTNTTSANLGATCFIASGFFTKYRTTSYSSMQEVRDDLAISSNSNIYKAALTFFSQTGAAVPWYVGRRKADDVILTPTTISNNTEYSFKIEVYDEDTLEGTTYVVSYDSDADATAAEIATGIDAAFTAASVANATATDNGGTVTIAPAAGYGLVITELTSNLTETFTSTESASDVFSAILEEIEEDFYFTTAEDHTQAFVLALAVEVSATASSDFPKQYHFSVQEADAITPYVQGTSTDTLAQVMELGYDLVAGMWHHSADRLFPELAMLAVKGALQPAVSSWKHTQVVGVEAVQNPVTGKNLTTGKQGYIKDRNASWFGIERGVNYYHGGTMASSAWIDNIRLMHWTNDQIETRLLNLLLNTTAAGSKISFLDKDIDRVLSTINSVLSEGVTRGVFTGYIPASLIVDPSFADQATRTLNDITFVSYISGSVHFIFVDGVLTYQDATLA